MVEVPHVEGCNNTLLEIIDDLLRLRERKVTWLPKKMGFLLFLREHQMKLLIF